MSRLLSLNLRVCPFCDSSSKEEEEGTIFATFTQRKNTFLLGKRNLIASFSTPNETSQTSNVTHITFGHCAFKYADPTLCVKLLSVSNVK